MKTRQLVFRGYDVYSEYLIYKEKNDYRFQAYRLSKPEDELKLYINNSYESFSELYFHELYKYSLMILPKYLCDSLLNETIELLNISIQNFKQEEWFTKAFIEPYAITGAPIYKQWEKLTFTSFNGFGLM